MQTREFPRVAALIAAAGRSTRMGMPKAQLLLNETTFLESIANALHAGGVECIFVTLPDAMCVKLDSGERMDKVASPQSEKGAWGFPRISSSNVEIVRNIFPHRHLLGSVQSVLSNPRLDADALLICPIDMPFVSPQLVSEFLVRPLHNPALIVAAHRGQTGHPLLVTRHLFKEISDLGDRDSIRVILQRHPAQITLLEANDSRVVVNINTPEDYARFTKPSASIFDAAATEAPGAKSV